MNNYENFIRRNSVCFRESEMVYHKPPNGSVFRLKHTEMSLNIAMSVPKRSLSEMW